MPFKVLIRAFLSLFIYFPTSKWHRFICFYATLQNTNGNETFMKPQGLLTDGPLQIPSYDGFYFVWLIARTWKSSLFFSCRLRILEITYQLKRTINEILERLLSNVVFEVFDVFVCFPLETNWTVLSVKNELLLPVKQTITFTRPLQKKSTKPVENEGGEQLS